MRNLKGFSHQKIISVRIGQIPEGSPYSFVEHHRISASVQGIVGHNHYVENGTCHAEDDLVEKVKDNPRFKRRRGRFKFKHIVVVKDGGNSKPCGNCIETLNKNFNIHKITYNVAGEGLVTVNFSKLLNESEHYISRGDRIVEGEEDEEDPEKLYRIVIKYPR